jgi:hypothetical protein
MIFAQTRSAFVARENRYTPIGSLPEGMLFRIMLLRKEYHEMIALWRRHGDNWASSV